MTKWAINYTEIYIDPLRIHYAYQLILSEAIFYSCTISSRKDSMP